MQRFQFVKYVCVYIYVTLFRVRDIETNAKPWNFDSRSLDSPYFVVGAPVLFTNKFRPPSLPHRAYEIIVNINVRTYVYVYVRCARRNYYFFLFRLQLDSVNMRRLTTISSKFLELSYLIVLCFEFFLLTSLSKTTPIVSNVLPKFETVGTLTHKIRLHFF